MRLWSIHPRYLDTKGLVALWRESLLAQKVLLGKTRGYTRHPQLWRFRNAGEPLASIQAYLREIHHEALTRGYNFNVKLITESEFDEAHRGPRSIPVTTGQISYEMDHLMKKLAVRDPPRFSEIRDLQEVELHPLFWEVQGEVEDWERPGEVAGARGLL